MEIPRKYHFSPILSLILLSLIIVVLVLRSRQLLEFAPIATGSKPPYSVPLDRLRTKLSGENPLHAVGNSGELRRNKFRNRTATVSSTVFYFISLCLFRWFCFDELINFRAFRNSRFCCVNLDSVFLFSVCFFLWLWIYFRERIEGNKWIDYYELIWVWTEEGRKTRTKTRGSESCDAEGCVGIRRWEKQS